MNGHPGKVDRKFYKCNKSTASLENKLEPYQPFCSYFLEVLMVENKYLYSTRGNIKVVETCNFWRKS